MSLCAEGSSSLCSDVQKRAAGEPGNPLLSALEEQLSYDRDSDSLTTSPSSSSLDTCSSHRIYQVFGKCEGSPGPQGKSDPAGGRAGGECSGACSPETEACSAEESQIPRSVTDGELKQRIPNPLSQHGVSRGQILSLPPRISCLGG